MKMLCNDKHYRIFWVNYYNGLYKWFCVHCWKYITNDVDIIIGGVIL